MRNSMSRKRILSDRPPRSLAFSRARWVWAGCAVAAVVVTAIALTITVQSPSAPSKPGVVAPVPPPTCAAVLGADDEQPPVGAPTKLVPGHPQAAVACRYAGADEGEPVPALDASAEVPAAEVGHLARAMNSGRRPPGGTSNCPADDGARDVVKFAYAASPTITVVIRLTCCQYAVSASATVAPSGSDNGF